MLVSNRLGLFGDDKAMRRRHVRFVHSTPLAGEGLYIASRLRLDIEGRARRGSRLAALKVSAMSGDGMSHKQRIGFNIRACGVGSRGCLAPNIGRRLSFGNDSRSDR